MRKYRIRFLLNGYEYETTISATSAFRAEQSFYLKYKDRVGCGIGGNIRLLEIALIDNNSDDTEDKTTTLIETAEYIDTGYTTMHFYKCEKCGADELLNAEEFKWCPYCGRKVIRHD